MIIFVLTSCATKPMPKNPCTVELKEKIDMFSKKLNFKGNIAKYSQGFGTCSFYFWGCKYTQTRIDDNNAIWISGSGLFNSDTKVAKLENSKVIYDKTFIDKLARVSDMEVSMEKGKVYRKIDSDTMKSIVGDKYASSIEEVDFGPSCTKKEAAIGAITLLKAKDLGI
jgi:hypothetical protein